MSEAAKVLIHKANEIKYNAGQERDSRIKIVEVAYQKELSTYAALIRSAVVVCDHIGDTYTKAHVDYHHNEQWDTLHCSICNKQL